MITGTFINVIAIVIGGGLGAALGNRLPEKARQTVLHGLGLMTLVIGITMAIETRNALIPLFSILIGGIVGEALHLEEGLERLGRWVERRSDRAIAAVGARRRGSADQQAPAAAEAQDGVAGAPRPGDPSAAGRPAGAAQGFITASLIFCVGPMAVLGSIQDGLMGNYTLLTIKSLMDCFASMALAATLGVSVILSAGSVFGYQGVLSLLAAAFGAALGGVTGETPWVIEMTATGGVVILGIALMLLDIKRIRVASLVPAIFVAPVIVLVMGLLGVQP